jgi:hypothetical protein
MIRLRVPIAISLLALAAVAGPGHSKPVPQTGLAVHSSLYCSSNNLLSADDVTFGTIPGSNPGDYYSADDCYGSFDLPNASSGTEESAANDIWGSLYGGGGFTEILRSAPSTGAFGGATFALTASSNPNVWTLEWDTPNNLALDLVVLLRTGLSAGTGVADSYAAYLFDDQFFSAGNGSDNGTYRVSFTSTSLSRFSVLVRNGDVPECSGAPGAICTSAPVLTNGVTAPDPATVPEPAPLPILATGLLGLAVLRRRLARR